jgi:hypothetical protein
VTIIAVTVQSSARFVLDPVWCSLDEVGRQLESYALTSTIKNKFLGDGCSFAFTVTVA